MKVSELIKQLEGCDPDSEVVFAYNYGDHWETKVAQRIDRVDEEELVRSERLRKWTVPDVMGDGPGEGDETKDAVVLS